jgi:Cu2+-exporting ATPase
MTATFEHARPSACPACNAAPAAEHLAELPKDATLMLSLPGIHCAGCISGVEKVLNAVPGVRSARVNLTLRRAAVEAGPEVTADDLTAVLDRAGYEAHELDAGVLATTEADRQGKDLLMRLAVAFFAMMNVMLLSVAVWSGAEGFTRDMMHWISAAIAIPAVVFSGRPFYVSAWGALRGGRLNMDVPITLAIGLAVGTSLYETMMSGHHAYFDAAIMLCFFLLGGRYLDHRTRASARSAAQELAALEVPRALRVTAAGEETVAAAELAVGDIVRVKPGGRIPVDGIVMEGQSELDRSLMTGESLPVYAGPGMAVSAGEVNLTGPLMVEVRAAGRDTSLHRIADLVAVAESGAPTTTRSQTRRRSSTRPGCISCPCSRHRLVDLHAGSAHLAQHRGGGSDHHLPLRLGLAVPAVTTAASGRLFRKGLLIKDGTALERLSEADTVVFDKTGTLTTGAPEPVGLDATPRRRCASRWRWPMRRPTRWRRPCRPPCAPRVCGPRGSRAASEAPGFGVEGIWRGQSVRLGRAAWLGAEAPDVTATFLKIGEATPRAIRFTDTLREGAAETVAALKAPVGV